MENLALFIFSLIAFVVGVIIFKKVAGCLIKTILITVVVAVLVAIYFMFIKG